MILTSLACALFKLQGDQADGLVVCINGWLCLKMYHSHNSAPWILDIKRTIIQQPTSFIINEIDPTYRGHILTVALLKKRGFRAAVTYIRFPTETVFAFRTIITQSIIRYGIPKLNLNEWQHFKWMLDEQISCGKHSIEYNVVVSKFSIDLLLSNCRARIN